MMLRLSSSLSVALSASLVLLVASSSSCAGGSSGEGEGEGEPAAQTCLAGSVEVPLPDAKPGKPNGNPFDLACIGSPEQGTSQSVTLEGCIDVFGLGGAAKRGIEVSVFEPGQDPKTGTPIGTTEIAVEADAQGKDCGGADANDTGCRALTCDKRGFYRIPNVPSETPITFRINLPGDITVIDTYIFDVVFRTGEIVDGAVNYEAALIYRSTYDSIPTLAGRVVEGQQAIGDGQGRGVIAGEIHDCADEIIEGATVTSNKADASTKVTYFDGNEEDPKPDLTRKGTNTDGLYVLLNATTDAANNEHVISAGMFDPACSFDGSNKPVGDCQCLSLSSRTIRAYPDSVSIVTLRGDLP